MHYDNLNFIKSKIQRGICGYVATLPKEHVEDMLFNTLVPYINFNNIPDKDLIQNERLMRVIKWELVDRRKIIRIICREPSIIEKIDLKNIKFSIDEVLSILMFQPSLIELFDINLEELSGIDAVNIINIIPQLATQIDFAKYSFTNKEIKQIVDKFFKNEVIMNQLDISKLDSYEIRKLLERTGKKYLHKININKLTSIDWLSILKYKPELLHHCDLSVFEKGDCYMLIKLIIVFPELDYMIEKNKDKISGIGWEELLTRDPIKYSNICNYAKLSKKNWSILTMHRPEFKAKMGEFFIR